MVREAFHQIRMLRGHTRPHLFLCSDNTPYVIKLGSSKQPDRQLASEYIASQLSRWVGLPTPDCALINVPKFLMENTPQLIAATAEVQYRFGLQFGSRLIGWDERGPLFDYLPESRLSRITNLTDFAGAFAFDIWSSNQGRRQAVFHRKRNQDAYSAYFIDYGACFSGAQWSFSERGGNRHYHPIVYREVTGWESFDPFLTRLVSIQPSVLEEVAAAVPAQWYDGNRGSLDYLLERLLTRRSQLHKMIAEARKRDSDLFPSWQARVFVSQTHQMSVSQALIRREPAT